MPEETNLKGKIVFKCLNCGFKYGDKKLAEKCEEWCKKHSSCNVEISKHTIKTIQRRK